MSMEVVEQNDDEEKRKITPVIIVNLNRPCQVSGIEGEMEEIKENVNFPNDIAIWYVYRQWRKYSDKDSESDKILKVINDNTRITLGFTPIIPVEFTDDEYCERFICQNIYSRVTINGVLHCSYMPAYIMHKDDPDSYDMYNNRREDDTDYEYPEDYYEEIWIINGKDVSGEELDAFLIKQRQEKICLIHEALRNENTYDIKLVKHILADFIST
jgi:hypothetical protein